MYQSELGTPLVMYHDAHDGQPPKQEDGFPEVDSFVAYDFQALISGDKRCELARVAPASRAGGSTTAQNIPLARVCEDCRATTLAKYRPEILRPYTQADVDEPIEAD
jgi:hypothetical protein